MLSCRNLLPDDMDKWTRRMLGLASHVAEWSKDPSTQVGAVIVDERMRVLSLGFNGFPRGVEDHPSRYSTREVKYDVVQHAEANAILFATRDLHAARMFVTHPPCSSCMGMIVQAGISEVTAYHPDPMFAERQWRSLQHARMIAREAGVALRIAPAPSATVIDPMDDLDVG